MEQVLRLENAQGLNEGAAFSFDLVTTVAEQTLVAPAEDIGQFLAFFAHAALLLSEDEDITRPTNQLAPIPTAGLGLQSGSTPDSTLLVVNVAGHGLAFEMPSSQLADNLERLARSARTLAASGMPQ